MIIPFSQNQMTQIRQVVLDTETTGLEPRQGHKIIEIGCVELIDRQLTGNNFQQYLNPEREIDEGAVEVHGIELADLQDKPIFGDIAEDFLAYIKDAELIIHNAPFDLGFLNHEMAQLDPMPGEIADYAAVLDTLPMARQMHPGQRNSLDALCQRYGIVNSHRELHGALLDSEILADVYLAMSGGQLNLLGELESRSANGGTRVVGDVSPRQEMLVVKADEVALSEHQKWVEMLEKATGEPSLWRGL